VPVYSRSVFRIQIHIRWPPGSGSLFRMLIRIQKGQKGSGSAFT
jgi:hypothetical protein